MAKQLLMLGQAGLALGESLVFASLANLPKAAEPTRVLLLAAPQTPAWDRLRGFVSDLDALADALQLSRPLTFDFAPMPEALPAAPASDADAGLTAFYGDASDGVISAAAWLAPDGAGTSLLQAWVDPDRPVDLFADLRDTAAAALLPHMHLNRATAWLYRTDAAEQRAIPAMLADNGFSGCCCFAVPKAFTEPAADPDWLKLIVLSRWMQEARPQGVQAIGLPVSPMAWGSFADEATAASWQGLFCMGLLWHLAVLPALQTVLDRAPSPLERFPRWLGIGKIWKGLPKASRSRLKDQAASADRLLTAAVGFLRRAAALPVQLARDADYLHALSEASARKRALLDHFGMLAIMEHEIDASGMEKDAPVARRSDAVSAVDELLAARDAARDRLQELQQLCCAAMQPIGSWACLQLNRRMQLSLKRAMAAEAAQLSRLPQGREYFRLATHLDGLRYEAAYLAEEEPNLRQQAQQNAAFSAQPDACGLFPAEWLTDWPIHPDRGQMGGLFADPAAWERLMADLQHGHPAAEESISFLLRTCWEHALQATLPFVPGEGYAFALLENEPAATPAPLADFLPLPDAAAFPPVFRAEACAMADAQQQPDAWQKRLVLALLLPDAGFRLNVEAMHGAKAAELLTTVPASRAAFGLKACYLVTDHTSVLLGCLCPPALLLPTEAALPDAVTERFPWIGQASWMQAMPQSERSAALRLLDALLPQNEGWLQSMLTRLIEALQDVDRQEEHAVQADPWGMETVCCTALGFEPNTLMRRKELWLKPAPHPLMEAWGIPVPQRAAQMTRLLFLRDQPLAVEHTSCLWYPLGDEAMLTEAAEEAALMMRSDLAWRQQLRQRLLSAMQSKQLWPVCRDSLTALTEALQETESDIVLTYPRRTDAPAARLLLTRLLGAEHLDAALAPFSDRLCMLPTAAATAWQELLPPTEPILWNDAFWQLLPPFSPAFGQLLMRSENLNISRLSAVPMEDGESEALLLRVELVHPRGRFVIERRYTEGELLLAAADLLPTVRISPSVSLPNWHHYTAVLEGEAGYSFADAASRAFTGSAMPDCMGLMHHGVSIGVLPNPERTRDCPEGSTALVGLEIGHSAVSIAISMNGVVQSIPDLPLELVLLAPQPVQPVRLSPILSCAMAGDRLWSDAADCWTLSGDISAYPFRTDEEINRFACLVLRRVAWSCAVLGASDAELRMALPMDLPPAGLRRYQTALAEAAKRISDETGFSLHSPRFADSLQGLTAYVRAKDGLQLSGSLLLADLGSDCLHARLLLGGFKPPVHDRIVPAGIHAMLLDTLLEHPDLLQQEFGHDADGRSRMQLQKLHDALKIAAVSRTGLSYARLLLDAFLQEQLPWLGAQMRQSSAMGAVTTVEALLLLGFAAVIELTAAAITAALDDHRLHDHVPQEMLLCPSGRGWRLMDALHPARTTALWRLLQSTGIRVEVLPSHLIKLEAAHGLLWLDTDSGDPPMLRADDPLGKDRLLRFVAGFCQTFPDAGEKLFPHFWDGWGRLSQQGYTAFMRVCAAYPPDDLNELPAALSALRHEIAQSIH